MELVKKLLLKKFMRFKMLLIFAFLLSACHKEDLDDYALTADEFTQGVIQEQNFQMALIARLKQNPSSAILLTVSKTREIFIQDYQQELVAMNFSDEQPHMRPLSEDQLNLLTSIDFSAGLKYESAIIKMLVDSDQNMIALHIRASSNSGLADPQLRGWTEMKLPQLRNNLKGTQNLK